MKNTFILLALLISFTSYSQESAIQSTKYGSSFILSMGQPNYQHGEKGFTYGMDYILDINNKWEFDLFFQQHKNDALLANRHSHFGLSLGRKHYFLSRLEFSYGFGVGHTTRNELYTRYISVGPVMNGWFGPYRERRQIVLERKTNSFSTNMKLNLGIKITEKISVGTFMRTSWGEDLNFATFNGYVGIRI